MINKNKEEIEKINETIDLQIKFSRYWKDLQIEKEATIKTSILWCENFLEKLLYLGFCCDDLDFEDGCACGRCKRIKETIEQLQTHLKWLKEQEKAK